MALRARLLCVASTARCTQVLPRVIITAIDVINLSSPADTNPFDTQFAHEIRFLQNRHADCLPVFWQTIASAGRVPAHGLLHLFAPDFGVFRVIAALVEDGVDIRVVDVVQRAYDDGSVAPVADDVVEGVGRWDSLVLAAADFR